MPKTRALGIDISHYQKMDWAKVAPYIDFAWCKASEGADWKDPTLTDNIQALYDAGKPAGIYHYFITSYYSHQFSLNDPTRWPTPEKDLQLQNFIQCIRYKTFSMLAVDIEETNNRGEDPQWISEAAKRFCGRVQDWLNANRPGVPLFVYSRNTFINQYAPGMNNWIHQYNSWIAQWTYNSGSIPTTWDIARGLQPDDLLKPGYFSTRPTWEMWQWTGDRFILPGVLNTQNQPRTIDLDVYNGTREQLYAWLKFAPGTPTPPQKPPTEPPAEPGDYITRAEFDELKQALQNHTHTYTVTGSTSGPQTAAG